MGQLFYWNLSIL